MVLHIMIYVSGERKLSIKLIVFNIHNRTTPEWICGMKTGGSFGHFKPEYVTEVINPIADIRAKVAAGEANVSELSIGSPTDVDHMVHYSRDGTKWATEGAPSL